MDAWLIVLITIVSGVVLFSICFSIKLRKHKKRAAARSGAYSSTVVVQPTQSTNPQNPYQQTPYQQNQSMPYPPQVPYSQNQSMPYPPQAPYSQNQSMPYPPQMPYPQQSNQQSHFVGHTQAMSFVPSTNGGQSVINPQQYFSPPQGIIVSTAPYNPTPSAPPVSRY